MDKVVASRREQYKQGLTASKGRNARLQSSIQVRKNKRMESLQKRRAMNTKKSGFNAEEHGRTLPEEVADAHLPLYVEAIASANENRQLEGIHSIRKLLSRECMPPVEAVVQAGVMPRIIELMETSSNAKLLFEAAWAITNIASTEHTRMVVELKALPVIANLLRHGDPDVREQSIWCIGNVTGDGSFCRDAVLATEHALQGIALNIQHPASESLLRNATWALSNCFRGKPCPALDVVAPAVPVLVHLLGSDDKEVLADASWGFSYLSEGGDDRVAAVVKAGAIPAIIQSLRHESSSVVIPALRTVGNVVTGSDAHTQCAVDNRVLEALVPLIKEGRRNVRREACWAVSNVSAGTSAQISRVVDTPGMLPALMHQLQSAEWNVKKEACWAICNIGTTGGPSDLRAIVAAGAIATLAPLLRVEDVRIVQIVLEALENIFDLGKDLEDQGISPGATEYYQVFEEAGGVDTLMDLQDHEEYEVYRKTLQLVEKHFNEDDDGEGGEEDPHAHEPSTAENFQPQQPPAGASPGKGGGFGFSAPTQPAGAAPFGQAGSGFTFGGGGGFDFSGATFQ